MTVAWGIDCSTRAVSLAVLTPDTAHTHTIHIDPAGRYRGAERCAKHLLALTGWIVPHNLMQQPDVVTVEIPFGNPRPHPSSYECRGVLLAVLGTHVHAPVLELSPTQWKDYAIADGGATKQRVLEFSRFHFDYTGHLQDEADALCIGAAGLYAYERELREAA